MQKSRKIISYGTPAHHLHARAHDATIPRHFLVKQMMRPDNIRGLTYETRSDCSLLAHSVWIRRGYTQTKVPPLFAALNETRLAWGIMNDQSISKWEYVECSCKF